MAVEVKRKAYKTTLQRNVTEEVRERRKREYSRTPLFAGSPFTDSHIRGFFPGRQLCNSPEEICYPYFWKCKWFSAVCVFSCTFPGKNTTLQIYGFVVYLQHIR